MAIFLISVSDTATGLAPMSSNRLSPSMPTFADFKFRRTILHAHVPSFDNRFKKWRFLQDLLDGDVDDNVVGELLLHVLDDYLNNQPGTTNDDTTTGSPELTPDLISKLHASIDALREDAGAALNDYSEAGAVSKLDELLPDPIEDEDAYKSAWDTVMEIHGQDMVRANETNPTLEWRKLCLVARLLIHFDFLSKT
jgi:hypothetical protein